VNLKTTSPEIGGMNPKIRLATPADGPLIYRMICELENKILNRADFDFIFHRNMANDLVGYFIADIGGVAVGMGSCHVQTLLHHASFVAEVQELFVYADHRSKKVGKLLMESRNYRKDAHRFYEREGFEKSHVKLVRYF
jgi:PhnO protein